MREAAVEAVRVEWILREYVRIYGILRIHGGQLRRKGIYGWGDEIGNTAWDIDCCEVFAAYSWAKLWIVPAISWCWRYAHGEKRLRRLREEWYVVHGESNLDSGFF